MGTPIVPETLRILRGQRRMSRKQFAEKMGYATDSTIKRIETSEAVYDAQSGVADKIAKALGVEVHTLGSPIEPAAEDRPGPYIARTLSHEAEDDVALAFSVVEDFYGISIDDQIRMAPLFTALLAEGSLAWRKSNLAAMEQATEKLRSAMESIPYVPAVTTNLCKGLREEKASIEASDLFGQLLLNPLEGEEQPRVNPFARYLKHLVKQMPAERNILDLDTEYEGESLLLPDYQIGLNRIRTLTGDDPAAEYALAAGKVKFSQIPEELLGDDATEARIRWLGSHLNDEEMAWARSRPLGQILHRVAHGDLGHLSLNRKAQEL